MRPRSAAPRRPPTLLALAVGPLLALLLAPPPAAAAERRPFAPPGTPAHYAPERGYDLLHRKIELAFDWDGRSVEGSAVNRLSPLLPGTAAVTLHAAGLDVRSVTVDGAAAEWSADPARRELVVELPRPAGPGDVLEVAVEYSARPAMGLYFVGPDDGYPDKPRQIWSQGESEFNRHWFPSWDYPNDRATTELAATVAPPFEVVSNGRLLGVDELPDGRRTFRWSMEQPHVTYLVSVVVGDLVEIEESAAGVPVEYWVPPGREEEARRSFGRTPAMLEFFAAAIDEPYPYAKYAQTAAVDFIWGGMENVSATTQTLATLHPAAAAPESSSDGLVAHELVHQWFGDLLTTDSWAHAWLNEGFATYFTGLWFEHAEGADAFAWERWQWRESYLREDREEYRRPIVTHRYAAPMEMFDDHLYEKGALVLHMVRGLTGEAGWWKAIRAYVDAHRDRTVVTTDFQTAVEEATGASLGALFDGYVHGAGHPELAVSWSWLPDRRAVRLDVEQTQETPPGLPQAETGLFAYPVEVALLAPDGAVTTATVDLAAARSQTFWLPAAERPETVVFDPDGTFLAVVDFDKPAAEWVAQLRASEPLWAKLQAIEALGERGGPAAIEALGEVAAGGHPFHAARSQAAKALAKIGTPAALAALEPALDDADSRVRTAALEGLGAFAKGTSREERKGLIARLAAALSDDRSPHVRAGAAKGLARFTDDAPEAAAHLLRGLEQPSHREVVREAAAEALADLGHAAAWDRLRRLAGYGAPPESRGAAMKALARLAGDDERRRSEAYDLLTRWARTDRAFRARQGAYDALVELADRRAVAVLEAIARDELDPQQRRSARVAAWKLRAAGVGDGERLERRVEELERELDRLRHELAERKDG